MDTPNAEIKLSVVMPCLNEEKTVGGCIKKAFSAIKKMGITGEVVISDNGSTDTSVSIAKSLGARVVNQPIKGYGAPLKRVLKKHGVNIS